MTDNLPKAGYAELFQSILDAPEEEGIQVVIFNHVHMARVRAGLSRQKAEYSKISKFCGEPDRTSGKQFEYTPVGQTVGLFRIRLVKQEKTEFYIVSPKKEVQPGQTGQE